MKPFIGFLVISLIFIFVGFSAVFVLGQSALYQFIPSNLSAKISSISRYISQNRPVSSLISVSDPIASDKLTEFINQYRENHQQTVLSVGPKTCLMAESALNNQLLDESVISQKCPECALVHFARFNQPLTTTGLNTFLDSDDSVSNLLLSPDFTHVCAATSSSEVVITFVTAKTVSPQPQSVANIPPKNFSEEQLWEALSVYRSGYDVPQLTQDERLCTYARKRVQDHLDKVASTPQEEYARVDKYPLDAHQGFQQDAESGLVFDITGKNEVAENLAYWPRAEHPIHVIEWGWDSSTEGHRETQLSSTWTHACLSGQDGFFVAIFGR
jgi:uncharacterized protein YkwD